MSGPALPLQTAIAALEAQRAVLGDAVVDAALGPLKAQLERLQAASGPATGAAAPSAARAGRGSESAPDDQSLRQVTILFLDIVGSTALSTRLDPEDVHAVVDGLLARGTSVIRAHGGRVLQYAGDSILAVFGAAQSLEDDAERAVHCGLALLAAGRAAGAEVLAAHGHAGFDVRVGVHTGPVLLGGGVDGEGAVRGMAVNVAARMEQAAPPGALRISQATSRQVQGVFDLEPQDPIVVKGLAEPMRTWLVRRARARSERNPARGLEGLRPPMVGRRAELLMLQQAWQQLHAGDGARQGTTLVVAEAGFGKSRLLAEFDAWRARQPERCQVFRGRADPSTERQPYGLLRDLLAAALGIDDGDAPALAARKLEQGLLPLLAPTQGDDLAEAHVHLVGHLIGLDFGASRHLSGILDDPAQLRSRAFHAVALLFRALAAPGQPPLLVTLDDLHWADDGTLDVLDFLARGEPGLPIRVLGFARPALFERRPAWREPARAQRVDLSALDEAASRDLAAALLRELPEAPPALTALLTERAAGVPFFMEELVKMLVDQGALEIGAQGWTLQPGRLQPDAVPVTLTGVLQSRIDRLPGAERLALQQASVIGTVFWAPALAALDAEAPAQLPALVGRGLVRTRVESSLHDAEELDFSHHLLREVTYDTVLKRTRRDLHARAGAWLAGQTGLRAEGLASLAADHFERAGDAPRAVEQYARAADAARRRYANDEVLAAVARALALLPGCEPAAQPALRWRLLDARERTLDLLGRRDEQRADLEALDALAAGDARREADLSIRRCLLALRTGDAPGASALARTAMTQAAAAGDQKLRLNAQRLLADTLARQGEVAAALEWAQSGLAEVRAAGLLGLESRFLNALTVIHAQRNDLGALLATCERATRLRRELGDRRNEAIGLATLGGIWMAVGRFDEAAAVLTESLRLHRAVGNRAQEPLALANLSQLALWRGDAAGARQQAREALAIARSVQARDLEAFALWSLGQAELACDALAAADEAFAACQAAAGRGPYLLDARAGRARVALALGDLARAGDEVEAILAHRAAGGTLEGTLAPRAIELVCWQVLRRLDDPRAEAIITTAAATLRSEAVALDDEDLRRGMLERVPEHRQIIAAASAP